jgi:hypothetical protein
MKYQLICLFTWFLMMGLSQAQEPVSFTTDWIPDKPEMMTYSSTDKYGDQLYQVSIYKKNDNFEIYTNIISKGYTKTVCGTFDSAMYPLQSTAKIIVNGQVVMDTKCSYTSNNVIISTLMSPYNTTMSQNFKIDQRIIDFSQVPILVRTLTLAKDTQYTFVSLDPKTNTLVPLSLKVNGEGKAQDLNCFIVEVNDFEGKSIYWVEKGIQHRVIRVEQPESQRMVELKQ